MDKATFVKEIAQALRELEDNNHQNNNNNNNHSNNSNNDVNAIIHQTYQNFCYDDPMITNSTNTQSQQSHYYYDIELLQRSLLNLNSPYALSLRLILGIQQSYQKYYNMNNNHHPNHHNNNNNNIAEPESFNTPTTTTASLLKESSDNIHTDNNNNSNDSNVPILLSTLSQLLYCIHIQIPLFCCLSTTTLSQAIQYLGSYIIIHVDNVDDHVNSSTSSSNSPTTTTATTRILPDILQEPSPPQVVVVNEENHMTNGNMTHVSHNNNNNTSNNNNNGHIHNNNGHYDDMNHHRNDNDELQEVFAAESDDSDYEYESDFIPLDYNNNNNNNNTLTHSNLMSWINTIENAYDPIYLSQPPTTINIESITWDHIAMTIRQLIHTISSYTYFISISPIQWKKCNFSEPILQLCIAFLIQQPLSLHQHSPLFMTTIIPTKRSSPLIPVAVSNHNNNNNDTITTTTTVADTNNDNDTNDDSPWQLQLGIRLINIFRDIVMHHINHTIRMSPSNSTTIHSSSSNSHTTGSTLTATVQNDAILSMLEDYLRLIRILLLQDDLNKPNRTTTPTTSTLPSESTTTSSSSSPAILVGLSSLSSICHEVRIPPVSLSINGIRNSQQYSDNLLEKVIHTIQCTVIDVCDVLTDILVQSLSKSKEDVIAIQWTYLSFFQILTVVVPTTTGSIPTTTTTSIHNRMSNDYAQQLLNSGLFRQWLIVWSHIHQQYHHHDDDNDKDNHTTGSTMVQECILDLCLVSPSLLGKYAWRFPSLSDIVLPTTSTNNHPSIPLKKNNNNVSELFWNLLGMYYTSTSHPSVTTTSKVQWKHNNSKNDPEKPVKDTNFYQEQAWIQFQSMCANTLRVLTDWTIRREHNIDHGTTTDGAANKQLQSIVQDWNHLTNRLTTNSFLRQLFYEMLKKQQLQQQLSTTNRDNPSVQATGSVVVVTIQSELHPIQRLLRQCPTSLTTQKNNNEMNNVPLQPNDTPSSSTHHVDDDDVNDDDEDNEVDVNDDNNNNNNDDDDDDDNDKDRIIKKKTVHRNRMNFHQEIQWIGHLRQSIKILLVMCEHDDDDNKSLRGGGTQQLPPHSNHSFAVSNKID